MKRVLFSWLLSIVFSLSIFTPTVSAASESITSFDVDLNLTAANTLSVTEQIVYDFSTNERRGIFRDIPTVFRRDDGLGFKYELSNFSVTRDGVSEQYQISGDEIKNIRIGNPNVFITGSHEYELSYTLAPVVFQSTDGSNQDVLRYDAVGSGWSVPIERASVSLSAPVDVIETACYSGEFGSTERDCTTAATETTASFSATDIGNARGLTIDAVFSPNSFATYPQFTEIATSDSVPAVVFWVLLGIAGLFFGVIGGFIYHWWRYNRRKKQELIIPQYEPPEGFTPGEVGLLSDHVSNAVEFTATLIDLAIRGYIKIEEIKPPKWWRKGEYKLIRKNPDDDKLKPYEKELLQSVMGSKSEVKLNDVEGTKIQSAIKKLDSNLRGRLEEKGYYIKAKPWDFISRRFTKWTLIILGILVVFTFGTIILLLIFAYLGWGGVGQLYSRLSSKGYSGWAHIEGFKDFLSTTEKDRVKFHDAPQQSPEQFRELLPYAVALGVEKEWVKQFEHLAIEENQDWYASRSGIAPAVAINSLTGGLNSQARSAYTAGSSSGGGGGFSGGGVGGGGGGSW